MRIAICFSGMIRTGVSTHDNIKNFIGDLWDNCDFFVHTWDDNYQNPLYGESYDHYNEKLISTNKLDITTFNNFINLYEPKISNVESHWNARIDVRTAYLQYINIQTDKWWFPLFYSWNKSVEYKTTYEKENEFEYDYCVKLRPDVIFQTSQSLKNYLDLIIDNEFGINQIWIDNDNITNCDDIIFMSKSNIMNHASLWWKYWITSGESSTDYIKALPSFYNFLVDIVKTKPIDLMLHYLDNGPDSITLYREECNIFDSITEFEKCQECDRFLYHTLKRSKLTYITDKEFSKLTTHSNNIRDFFPEFEK